MTVQRGPDLTERGTTTITHFTDFCRCIPCFLRREAISAPLNFDFQALPAQSLTEFVLFFFKASQAVQNALKEKDFSKKEKDFGL